MATRTMVLLKHELPTGAFHFDLMVQLNGPGSSLKTWRTTERIDELRVQSAEGDGAGFPAQPLGDHRAIYLDFEGDIGGGRGAVTRVAEGAVHLPNPDMIVTSDQVIFDAEWHTGVNKGRRLRYAGWCDSPTGGGGGWVFHISPI